MLYHLSLHSQVIGAVLNSFGIGTQTTNTATGGAQPNTQVIFVVKKKLVVLFIENNNSLMM